MTEFPDNSKFKIYNVYSNNMLVQQNKPFVVAGTGLVGLEIEFSLKKVRRLSKMQQRLLIKTESEK